MKKQNWKSEEITSRFSFASSTSEIRFELLSVTERNRERNQEKKRAEKVWRQRNKGANVLQIKV